MFFCFVFRINLSLKILVRLSPWLRSAPLRFGGSLSGITLLFSNKGSIHYVGRMNHFSGSSLKTLIMYSANW